jgi:hypothetical protein
MNWLSIVDELYRESWDPNLNRHRSRFAFRGMSRAGRPLETSLFRLASGPHLRRIEQGLTRNFRKYARGERPTVDSVWGWLALAQHRGLPTRLLDWTYSPLVALHFATANIADFDVDGAVWCAHFPEVNRRIPAALRRLLHEESSDAFTVEMLGRFKSLAAFDRLTRSPFAIFLEPPALDTRVLNQHALFSLMSSPEAQIQTYFEQHPELCRCVTVPAALKWEIRDKLDQANINERVLFPGLDGLSRWLARYYMSVDAPGAAEQGRLQPEDPSRRRRPAAGRPAAARPHGPVRGPRRHREGAAPHPGGLVAVRVQALAGPLPAARLLRHLRELDALDRHR